MSDTNNSTDITPNFREAIWAYDPVLGKTFKLKGTSANGALNVNATASLAGTALPISGATTAVGVAIVDGSGNQITSFGGGTQYVDGGAVPTHPTAPTLVYDAAGTWQHVSAATPLPVTGSLTVGGTTDNSAFTAGTSTGTPAMGFYHSVIDTVTDGRAAAVAITPKRAMMVNLNTAAGVEIGTSGSPLRTDPTGTTPQPVSGTVAATQSGTWNITNISGTVSLPTGASTAALQTTGNTSLATIATNTTNTTVAQGSATSGQPGQLVQGAVTTGAPAYTTAQTSPLSLTTAGGLRIDGSGTTQPVSNAGTFAVQATLAAETTKVIGTVNQGTSPWVVSGTVTANAGTGNFTVVNGGTFATQVTSLPALPAGTNVIGHVITDTGSTTAVTGNVTVTQATGTNLHTVLDSGTLTSITNALPAGANLIGKVGIDQTTPGTTNKVDIADSLNNPVSAFPATFLRTSDEPRQVFYDPFDSTLDVTNRWTSTQGSSGVAASNTTGVMSLGTGTVANGYSKLTSQPAFTLPIPAWLGASDAIAIPDLAAPTANSYRFWGCGTTLATPTTTTPLTDAVGFELSTAGKMFAVIYAGGTRTAIQDLSTSGNSTQPADANSHRYICYIRTDKAYWYIDGITSAQLVATSNFQSPQVQTLPRLFLAVGGPTPPASNSQITCTGATAWDTGKNATQLADGTFPWRKATISATGAISVNNAQLAGATVSVNNGTTDGGTQRVTLSSDSTGQVKLAAGTNSIGAVTGPTASGSALTVPPLTIGGLAKTANPTAVADGQVVNAAFDKLGKQVVVGSIRDLKANPVTTITASTAETTIVAQVASTFLDMYGIIISNISATAVNVAIKDATAGTTRFNFAIPAGDTRGFMLPEGGAVKQSAVNNNWTATVSASVTSIIITALVVANT